MPNSNDIALKLMEEQIPGLNKEDVGMLIEHLVEIATQSRHSNSKDKTITTLDQWTPSPNAVKETLAIGIRVVDIKYCIEDFQRFALSRKWTLDDNLDAKFIAHVKIMVSQGKITLAG